MGLFRLLCGEREPTAFQTYVASPRNRRSSMLKSAMERYKGHFQDSEVKQLLAAMKAFDKLASIRNEIAHGHCSEVNGIIEGEVAMVGHYLLPSFNERGWHERSFRYSHTADTINAFTTAVREQRGIVMDIQFAIMTRAQDAEIKVSAETKMLIELAKAVADGRIPPEEVARHLKRA